jgi:hypothetical protein
MKRNRFAVMGLVIGGIFLVAALVWAASSNGPYYALPAWDQKLPASTRFVVLLDWNSEAVLDRNTGLVWEKSPAAATATWITARRNCANKNVGGQKGWRLPAFAELASLIDPSVASPGPTLPPGHPFINVNGPPPDYWSATTNPDSPTTAWFVSFGDAFAPAGFVLEGSKAGASRAWCVRGGMNADAY